jgi:transcriptional regulator with XRE-family HTH domain
MRISSDETKKNIGWIIRESREKKEISQSELCDKANITQTFLSLVEHNKRNPSYDVLERIAKALGEDPEVLAKEASSLEIDTDTKLNHLFNKVLKSKNKRKLQRLLEFMETLG